MKHFILCAVLASVLSVGVAISPCRAANSVVDSGAWVLSQGLGSIYWMDDREVIFVGRYPVDHSSVERGKSALLQWRIGERPRVLRQNVDSLCYRPGQITYAVHDVSGGGRTYFTGPLGHERPAEMFSIDTLNCDIYKSGANADGRVFRRLLPGHGRLYLGAAKGTESLENTPVVHIADGSGKETRLPFGRKQLSTTRYYEFKKAYFVHTSYFDPTKKYARSWPQNTRATSYWLSPDGRYEAVEYPSDIVTPEPTKLGLAYRVLTRNGSKDGIYLYKPDGRRDTVVRGYVTEMTISPDGCRVAFVHAPDAKSDTAGPNSRRTLKVTDLCQGDKK